MLSFGFDYDFWWSVTYYVKWSGNVMPLAIIKAEGLLKDNLGLVVNTNISKNEMSRWESTDGSVKLDNSSKEELFFSLSSSIVYQRDIETGETIVENKPNLTNPDFDSIAEKLVSIFCGATVGYKIKEHTDKKDTLYVSKIFTN